MRISIDPMPQLRAKYVELVNNHFNRVASENVHKDQAYSQKRTIASQVEHAFSKAPSSFSGEAELRGVSLVELAGLVLSKPDTIGDRELLRQQTLRKIADAQDLGALDQALLDIGVRNGQ